MSDVNEEIESSDYECPICGTADICDHLLAHFCDDDQKAIGGSLADEINYFLGAWAVIDELELYPTAKDLIDRFLDQISDVGTEYEVDESSGTWGYTSYFLEDKKQLTDHADTLEKATQSVTATAMWGNDDVDCSIKLTPEQLEEILSGEVIHFEGEKYFYEGDEFASSWCFNGDGFKSVSVSYGLAGENDMSAEGFNGSLRGLRLKFNL